MNKQLKEKVMEALTSILPITAIVLLLSVTVAPLGNSVMMLFLFGALMLIFAIMGVDLAAVLLLVFAYLFVHGCAVYYRIKYEREM